MPLPTAVVRTTSRSFRSVRDDCFRIVHSDGPWHHPTRRERFPAEARRALGQETVADAVYGEEVTDLVGVGFEFLPELHHVRIHGAGVGEEFVAPDVETENRGQPVCRLADTWSKQFPGRN